jgi:hypothetical protein
VAVSESRARQQAVVGQSSSGLIRRIPNVFGAAEERDSATQPDHIPARSRLAMSAEQEREKPEHVK